MKHLKPLAAAASTAVLASLAAASWPALADDDHDGHKRSRATPPSAAA